MKQNKYDEPEFFAKCSQVLPSSMPVDRRIQPSPQVRARRITRFHSVVSAVPIWRRYSAAACSRRRA
jgi:hypothetical protein